MLTIIQQNMLRAKIRRSLSHRQRDDSYEQKEWEQYLSRKQLCQQSVQLSHRQR